MGKRYAPLLLLFVLAPSCTKQEGINGPPGPHARVKLRDGTLYSGMIAGSSATQVTLSGDDHATHILAMKDVQSINYDDAPAARNTRAAPPRQQSRCAATVATHQQQPPAHRASRPAARTSA